MVTPEQTLRPAAHTLGSTDWIALVLGAVFLVSAIGKLSNPVIFYYSVVGFEIVPEPAAYRIAMCLPWVELGVALSLLSGFCRRAALVLSTGMLGAFSYALIRAEVLHLHVSCDCFGVITGRENTVGWPQVLRTIFLFFLSCVPLIQAWRGRGAAREADGCKGNHSQNLAGGPGHAATA